MVLADFDAIDILWVALSIFLIVVGIALAIMFLRFAGTANRLTSLLGGVEERALPVITEVGGTVERVNEQLDKADVVTTSAVDAVSAVDRGVRGVAGAVSWPVRKISSFTTGVKHGAASLRAERDVTRAYGAGRVAADRRDSDIAEEMSEAGGTEAGVAERAASPEGADTSLAGAESAASWMDTDESEAVARARSAGLRQAESQAGEAGEAPSEPDQRPPSQLDG